MAKLLSTIENGSIDMKNSINLFPKKGNWLYGFNNASIKFFNITNTSDYNSWMSNASYADVTNFTIGTYINGIGLGGIDDNGRFDTDYMIRWLFNVKDGTFAMRGNPDYTVDYESNYYLNSNNYTKFMPTKTGSGASGTWGINISGNAAGLSKVLPVSKGGTGRSSFTTNGVLYFYNNSISNSSRYVADNSSLGIVSTTGNSDISVNNYYNCVKIFVSNNAGIYCRALGFTDGTSSGGRENDKNTAYYHTIQDWLIYINSAGVVTKGTSDRRKKFYIEDLSENETKVLLNTPIRNFIFKEDVNENNLEQNGIFAQDLREAMKANNISNRPWLQWEYNDNDRDDVYYDINSPEKDDMTYSVSYNHMVPALIKGWQMQNKEIEELEKKLAILRVKKINGLSS